MDPIQTVQAWEQFEAFMPNFAKVLGTYYKNLKAEGFDEDKAFELVLSYQTSITTTVMYSMKPKEE